MRALGRRYELWRYREWEKRYFAREVGPFEFCW